MLMVCLLVLLFVEGVKQWWAVHASSLPRRDTNSKRALGLRVYCLVSVCSCITSSKAHCRPDKGHCWARCPSS